MTIFNMMTVRVSRHASRARRPRSRQPRPGLQSEALSPTELGRESLGMALEHAFCSTQAHNALKQRGGLVCGQRPIGDRLFLLGPDCCLDQLRRVNITEQEDVRTYAMQPLSCTKRVVIFGFWYQCKMSSFCRGTRERAGGEGPGCHETTLLASRGLMRNTSQTFFVVTVLQFSLRDGNVCYDVICGT